MRLLRNKYPAYKHVFAIGDLATMVASYFIAIELVNAWENAAIYGEPGAVSMALWIMLAGVGTVSVFHYFNLYKLNVIVTVTSQILRSFLAILLTVIGGALVGVVAGHPIINERLFIATVTGLAFAGIVVVRILFLRNVYMLLSRYNIIRRKVLIAGAGETGKKLAVTLFLNKHIGIDVAGFLDNTLDRGTPVFGGARVVGRIEDVEGVASATGAREVVICVDNIEHSRFLDLVDGFTNVNLLVKICSPLYEVIPSRMFIEHYGDMPIISVSQRAPSPINETYKRVFDVVLASLAIIVLLPFLLVIGILIKLTSEGPIFYRQTRIGRYGSPFTFYKFRSMHMGSDTDEHRKKLITEMIRQGHAVELAEKGTTKIVNMTQVTRIGKWLRRTSLDELPQLLNVLKGDMSLVGPRPCLPYEWENYEEWHKKRLSISPGCTGVWQVSGRSEVGFRDMVILDLYYIQNASFHMDMRLILKTIPVMLFGKGGG